MKTTMTLEKQILDRIKTQGVKPTSKGYFRLRDYALWVLLGVFLAALSLGFGMVIFMINANDPALLAKLGLSTSERIIYSIPIFWILATLAIAGIAYINFRNTKRGYKTSARQFGLVAVLIAVALGSIGYAFNVTKFVDRTASRRIPLYNSVVPFNTNVWYDPAHGLLSGTVKEKDSDEDFTLRDSNSILWHVVGKNIFVEEGFTYHIGDRIKLIGKSLGNDTFEAVEIRPWEERSTNPEDAE